MSYYYYYYLVSKMQSYCTPGTPGQRITKVQEDGRRFPRRIRNYTGTLLYLLKHSRPLQILCISFLRPLMEPAKLLSRNSSVLSIKWQCFKICCQVKQKYMTTAIGDTPYMKSILCSSLSNLQQKVVNITVSTQFTTMLTNFMSSTR